MGEATSGFFTCVDPRMPRSLSSGAHSRDPLAPTRWLMRAALAAWCQQLRSTDGRLRLIFFGLRLMFRPVVRAGLLRVADGLGQHLAQFCLRLRRCPRDGCLPVSHHHYVGMPEGELNPTDTGKIRLRAALLRPASLRGFLSMVCLTGG